MRQNQLGYDMIPLEIRDQVFGELPLEGVDSSLQYNISNLESFGFKLPPKESGVSFPESMALPPLKAKTIQEHFEVIAREQLDGVTELAQEYTRKPLPPMPPLTKYQLNSGWTRYSVTEGGEWSVNPVPYPLEKVFTFDTETFVTKGSYPIIGTAVSSEACYIWLAKEFIDPSTPEGEWDSPGMVPVGTNRLIIAHNASYDRVRTQEAYTLDTGLENYWFDTLSAHIACCGLASGQRWLYVLSNKDPDLLTEEEKKRLRYKPKWLESGATNSLVEVYNFHVFETKKWEGKDATPMEFADKKIRDVFVKAESLREFQPLIIDLIHYALRDSWLTAELFQYLFPRYLDSTPSATALMGHFYLSGSRVPLAKNWEDWVKECEAVYYSRIKEMSSICQDLLQKEYSEWLVRYNLDTEGLSQKEVRSKIKEGSFPEVEKWIQSDPWRKQNNWTPKIIGNSKVYPDWRGKVLPEWCHKYLMDPSIEIGVKTRAAHLLLKLRWDNSPVYHTADSGWCYRDLKVPHPQRPGENVGCLLGKDFVKAGETGILSSELPEAKRALAIANEISYWTSVRNRVMERYARKVKNPYGEDCIITLPEILPHGTSTRRVVEPLFATMCSTKSFRIGTELKTRIEAPEGWSIVGGDFDS